MCLIAVLGKGNTSEYLILPLLALLQRAWLHFKCVHSLSSWQINEGCWWYHCSQSLILSVRFWSLLWVPAQRVATLRVRKCNSSWWMTLGGLRMKTAAQRRDLIPNSLPHESLGSGLSYIVSHLALFRLLNWTSNESTWPFESTWIHIWRIIPWNHFSVHSECWAKRCHERNEVKESNKLRSNKVPYRPLINREGMEKWVWGVWFEVLKMGCISLSFIKAIKAL